MGCRLNSSIQIFKTFYIAIITACSRLDLNNDQMTVCMVQDAVFNLCRDIHRSAGAQRYDLVSNGYVSGTGNDKPVFGTKMMKL